MIWIFLANNKNEVENMMELPILDEEGIDDFLEKFRQEMNLNFYHKDRAELYADYIKKLMWVEINKK